MSHTLLQYRTPRVAHLSVEVDAPAPHARARSTQYTHDKQTPTPRNRPREETKGNAPPHTQSSWIDGGSHGARAAHPAPPLRASRLARPLLRCLPPPLWPLAPRQAMR